MGMYNRAKPQTILVLCPKPPMLDINLLSSSLVFTITLENKRKLGLMKVLLAGTARPTKEKKRLESELIAVTENFPLP